MPLSDILRLELDRPKLTAQQMADQALAADREARRLQKKFKDGGSYVEAIFARLEANAIADECAKRAREEFRK